jgi:Lamin Tail Domain
MYACEDGMRHLLALASVTVLAACAVGSTDADSGDDGDDDVIVDGGSGGNTSSSSSTGGAGTTTTSGSGGDPATTSSSATTTGSGDTTTTSTATSSSSSTGGGNSCAHDVCTQGVALQPGCGDPCVDTVCNSDMFCCTTEWDDLCVDEANQLCGAMCAVGNAPSPGDLVITEIMNNPSAVSDTFGEWFEVYNDAPYTIDLLGLNIQHTAGDPNAIHTITQSVSIPSGGYVVLGRNNNSAVNGGVFVDYQYATVVLNNTIDYVALLDGSTVIDEVAYDESSGLDPAGASRNLDPIYMSASLNDNDSNFCVASSMMTGGDAGTPGSANDACP